MTEFHRKVRRYWRDGALYVIRDVWRRGEARRLMRCEYAVSNPNGSKKWLACVEGVEFATIQPLRMRACG